MVCRHGRNPGTSGRSPGLSSRLETAETVRDAMDVGQHLADRAGLPIRRRIDRNGIGRAPETPLDLALDLRIGTAGGEQAERVARNLLRHLLPLSLHGQLVQLVA